jgi:hypothetical protein
MLQNRHSFHRVILRVLAISTLHLVQMVDNGLGTTLLPTLAFDAGVLIGTSLVTRSLRGLHPDGALMPTSMEQRCRAPSKPLKDFKCS